MPGLKWTESKVPLASSRGGGVPEWPMHFKKHMREKDWAPHKDKIIRLRDSGSKTEDIQERLIREDGFHASIAQYKKILKDWRPKNLKRKQIRFIVFTCKRRGLNFSDVLPRFWYSLGKSRRKQAPYLQERNSQTTQMQYIEEGKVEDTVKRYWNSEEFSPNHHPSPAGLSVAPTPAPICSPDNGWGPSPIVDDYDSPFSDSPWINLVTRKETSCSNTNDVSQQLESLNPAQESSLMDTEDESVDQVHPADLLETGVNQLEEDFELVTGSPESVIEVPVVDLTAPSPLIVEESAPIVAPSASQPGSHITEQQITEFAENLLHRLNINPSINDPESIGVANYPAQDFREWEEEQENREKNIDLSNAMEVTMSRDDIDDIVEAVISGDLTDWIAVQLENARPPIKRVDIQDEEMRRAMSLYCDTGDFFEEERFEEAIEAAESSMEILLRREGVESERFISLYSQKGRILRRLKKYNEAAAHFRRAHMICHKCLGELHSFTLAASYDLILLQENTGHNSEALNGARLLWQTISGIPSSQIDKEISMIKDALLSFYIDLMYEAEEFSEGELFVRTQLEDYKRNRGEFSLETIRLMISLGDFIFRNTKNGRIRTFESIRVLNRAIKAADEGKILEKDPLVLMNIWSSKASAYRLQRWFQPSIFLSQKVMKSLRSLYGANRYLKEPFFLTSAIHLAVTYRDMNSYDMSLAYISRALPVLIDLVGPTHPDSLYGIELVCQVLYFRGMVRYAQPLVRNLPILIGKSYGPSDHRSIESLYYYYEAELVLSRKGTKMICN